MDLYTVENSIEWRLAFKSDLGNFPLGGTMEITPMCNMDCEMCYIRHSKEQVDADGGLLSVEQWLKIARDARAAGVLYLLITGGEPFTYPGFEILYREIMNMGFVVQINTNGTVINSKYRQMLKECPPRKLNITLYGTSNEEYDRICGNPKGFSQVKETIQFLIDNNIQFEFNYTISKENINSSRQIFYIASACNTKITSAHYLFAPIRKETDVNFNRLPVETVAKSMLEHRIGNNSPHDYALKQLKKLGIDGTWKNYGFKCRAGHSGFWIDWRGNLLPCGMFLKPKINLLEINFKDAWPDFVEQSSKIVNCKECGTCEYLPLCEVCAAKCYTETGSTDGKPEYQCKLTKEYVKLLISYLSDAEIEEYNLKKFLG